MLVAGSLQYRSGTTDQIKCSCTDPTPAELDKRDYLRAETITSANARLVDFQATLPLAQIWGWRRSGHLQMECALLRQSRTINAGPNRKYFGNNRGITWYSFVSDQYSGFHGIVIPGTLRDSIFVLEGLLERETGLNQPKL